jgi:glycosyltransferase involved in cell wall biosynthesis
VKVSALIPTYNRRTHTFRAIDSILAQTLAVDEIIVVDDGSTDGTGEAIRSHYGSKVRVIRQENAGVSSARNRALREARGEWVAFLDSDDMWFREKLALQFKAISTLGENEFGVCFTDCLFEGNAEMVLSAFSKAGLQSRSECGVLDDAAGYVLSNTPVMFVQSLLVRRSLIEHLGGFDESMVVSEDTDLLFRLALNTKVCFVTEPLVRIDRTPSREVGLCELYGSWDDRVYGALERMYSKWLSLPETFASKHEIRIQQMLRSLRYDSAMVKAQQFRFIAASRELYYVRKMENSYAVVFANLLSRAFRKLFSMIGRAVRPRSTPRSRREAY